MAIVGSGEYRYEMVEDWCKLPPGATFGRLTGVAVDSVGRAYVCQQLKDPAVLVFDPEGNYINSWGTGTIVEPHTIFVDADDNFYLADRGAHVVSKQRLDGTTILEMGTRGKPSDTGCDVDEGEVPRSAGPFNRPTWLSPSPSGDLYVSDGYRNARIHRFSADGALISSWGSPGKTAPGEFRVPHSIWVDRQGIVYVCDRWNNRIQIFSAAGEFVGQWSDVHLPTDIFMINDETVYVYERDMSPEADWISVRDKQGKVLARWDTHRSHQLWVDSHGDIYMTESPDYAINKFVRQH